MEQSIDSKFAVIVAPNEFSNGIVHTVDAVIALPTVATFAVADPTFTQLETALTADASFSFVNTLTSAGTFTVFAPTNDAFADLLAELEISGFGDLDTSVLAAALSLHVVNGANVRAEDLTTGTVTTLGGAMWGGFEFYKDYLDMKEQIQEYVAPDLSDFDKRLELVQSEVDMIQGELSMIIQEVSLVSDVANELKNDLRTDVRRIESIVEDVEQQVKQDARDNSKDLKETLTSIEDDMDELDKDINEAMTKLEETIDKRIKLSLDNPLSQMK